MHPRIQNQTTTLDTTRSEVNDLRLTFKSNMIQLQDYYNNKLKCQQNWIYDLETNVIKLRDNVKFLMSKVNTMEENDTYHDARIRKLNSNQDYLVSKITAMENKISELNERFHLLSHTENTEDISSKEDGGRSLREEGLTDRSRGKKIADEKVGNRATITKRQGTAHVSIGKRYNILLNTYNGRMIDTRIPVSENDVGGLEIGSVVFAEYVPEDIDEKNLQTQVTIYKLPARIIDIKANVGKETTFKLEFIDDNETAITTRDQISTLPEVLYKDAKIGNKPADSESNVYSTFYVHEVEFKGEATKCKLKYGVGAGSRKTSFRLLRNMGVISRVLVPNKKRKR